MIDINTTTAKASLIELLQLKKRKNKMWKANLPDRRHTQTQNEYEDYELQEQPYRIQREPDLTEEQEEYFRRRRQVDRSWIFKNTK